MTQDVINWLTISSMILFNIFCIIGIFTLIVIASSAAKIRSKTVETMNLAQETTLTVSQILEEKSSSAIWDILIFLAGAFFPKKRSKNPLEKMARSLRR